MRYVTFLVLSLILCSCGTIAPPNNVPDSPSSDPTNPAPVDPNNSGLIKYVYDSNKVVVGAIITSLARDRYNILVPTYAARIKRSFAIIIKVDDGISINKEYTVTTYNIDALHLKMFGMMNIWAKNNKTTELLVKKK